MTWDGTVRGLCTIAHGTAVAKGWWSPPREIPELLCLVHSEVSETLEAFRDGMAPDEIVFSDEGKPEGIPIELADAVIRIADMCCAYGIDLQEAIEVKLAYNETRPFRHGGKKV
jgi:hypothetical protein